MRLQSVCVKYLDTRACVRLLFIVLFHNFVVRCNILEGENLCKLDTNGSSITHGEIRTSLEVTPHFPRQDAFSIALFRFVFLLLIFSFTRRATGSRIPFAISLGERATISRDGLLFTRAAIERLSRSANTSLRRENRFRAIRRTEMPFGIRGGALRAPEVVERG